MEGRNKLPKTVLISPQAKEDIQNILAYLSQNWNQKVVDQFISKLEAFYITVSANPKIFSYYNKRKNIRKYVLTKQNIIFYRNTKDAIQIITVFDSRQDPKKLKNILK